MAGHQITVERRRKVIRVKADRSADAEAFAVARAKIGDISQRLGLTNVIIDATEDVDLPIVPKLLSIVLSVPHGLRVAMIVSPETEDLENLASVETFAINRGIYVVRFRDEADALEWFERENPN